MRAITLSVLFGLALVGCPDNGDTPDTTTDTAAETTTDADGGNDPGSDPAPDPTPDPAPDPTPDPAPDPTPETGPEIEEDIPPTPKICLDHLACFGTQCSGSDAAGLQTCVDGLPAACGYATDGSDVEGDLFAALTACAVTNGCVPDGSKNMYECLSEDCLSEMAGCFAGPTFGNDDVCFDLLSCNRANCPLTQPPNPTCQRTCAQDYTQVAVEQYIALDYCLEANCIGIPDKQTCFNNNPFCTQFVTMCPSL